MVNGNPLNASTVRGVMMEAGATVRQVNNAIDAWPEDAEHTERTNLHHLFMGTGLRRLQARVIYEMLVETLALFEDEEGPATDPPPQPPA